MNAIPGSLFFAKLVMMSSAPAKSAGVPDTRPKIHSFNPHCSIQYRLQSVLGVRSFYVERKYSISLHLPKYYYFDTDFLSSYM